MRVQRGEELPIPIPYFVIHASWIGWVECKTEEWLLAYQENGGDRYVRDSNGEWHCPPGEAFASQYGLGFKVRSTKEIKWTLVRNLEFLADYFHAKCAPASVDAAHRVQAVFSGERWMTLNQLFENENIEVDIVYKLVAENRLYIDLENELMSEPQYTTICRDKLSFEIYVNQKRNRISLPAIQLQAVQLASGIQFLWDGKPWRIVNVGVNEIFVEDGKRDLSNLRFDSFHELVAKGAIVGLPSEDDDRYHQAERMVKKAAPVDLALANKRMTCLADLDCENPDTSIPARTRRYWKMLAVQGEAAYGNSFVGVLPRTSARGNRNRKIAQVVIEIMNAVIDEHVLSAIKPNILVCYGFVVNICEEQALICPSEKTFRAEIAKRRDDLQILAREGRKAAYRLTEFHWIIDQSTPRHGERPFEVGHIDHTEVDLELVDSKTGANLGRAWLTVLMDAFTRMILAFFLTFDPPSYRSCMAVIREAIRRHGRIPKTIVVDQGSDFESLYFESLLARLECHKKSRPASKSRFGSVIERFFGITNQTLIHNLAGNSQALQRPRSMSPSHDPRRLAVWTLGKFMDRLERFVDVDYADCRHSALGMSPKEAMARGLAITGGRPHLLIPFTPDFNFVCMPSTPAGKAHLRSGKGLKIKNIHYWHPALRDIGGKVSLPVRYDPFDVSRAYALVRGDWLLCRSEYAAVFEKRTEREISIVSQEIRSLHIQHGIHRKTKAADMAAQLQIGRETEAVLRQQRHDAERQTSELKHAPEPPIPEISFESDTEIESDPWACPIKTEIFGELK
jgi:putative transposase